MALTFSSTNNVNAGSSATLDNINKGTLLAWVYATSGPSGSRIFQKGTGGTRHYVALDNTSGVAGIDVGRGTTNLSVTASHANFAAYAQNKWLFVAATWDTGGAAGDGKLYMGDRSLLAAEPSAYSAQTAGSGTVGDDSAVDMYVGNSSVGNVPFPGRIAVLCLVKNRILTPGEIISWQFDPRNVADAVLFWHLGYNGTTNVPDWSGSGNTGTITGATVADHVPLGPLFGWADAAPVPSPVTAYTLTATQGSFSLSGQAAALTHAWKLTAAQGAFTLSGQAATFGLTMPAAVGTFTLSGQAATLSRTYVLPAAQGSFALTGQSAMFGLGMPAATGAFAVSGQDAGLLKAWKLTAGHGTFTLTGQDASFSVAVVYTLPAAVGTFTLTGQAATFPRTYRLTAEAGVFTLSGQTATLVPPMSSGGGDSGGGFYFTPRRNHLDRHYQRYDDRDRRERERREREAKRRKRGRRIMAILTAAAACCRPGAV